VLDCLIEFPVTGTHTAATKVRFEAIRARTFHERLTPPEK